jgi:hypothetical protein
VLLGQIQNSPPPQAFAFQTFDNKMAEAQTECFKLGLGDSIFELCFHDGIQRKIQ